MEDELTLAERFKLQKKQAEEKKKKEEEARNYFPSLSEVMASGNSGLVALGGHSGPGNKNKQSKQAGGKKTPGFLDSLAAQNKNGADDISSRHSNASSSHVNNARETPQQQPSESATTVPSIIQRDVWGREIKVSSPSGGKESREERLDSGEQFSPAARIAGQTKDDPTAMLEEQEKQMASKIDELLHHTSDQQQAAPKAKQGGKAKKKPQKIKLFG